MGRQLETSLLLADSAAASAGGWIEGYASLFDRVDGGGDEVAPGAFASPLAKRPVKMLWNHDPSQPIGRWDDVREDGLGLWVGGQLITETRTGAEAFALMRAGVVDGLSIGYRAVRWTPRPEGGRRLLEVELWEISLVTFPMLEAVRARLINPRLPQETLLDSAADIEAERLALRGYYE